MRKGEHPAACSGYPDTTTEDVGYTWLPVAARIKFKSLMLAYRVLTGSAPTYLNALVRANVTPRTLRSSSERRLALCKYGNLDDSHS